MKRGERVAKVMCEDIQTSGRDEALTLMLRW
jgi:hypothetical protein